MAAFRKVCRWLHRELGFFAVGLTLVYAISGFAVNHARQFDSNYSRSVEESSMDPVGALPTAEIEPLVLSRLALEEPIKNTWRSSPDELLVFLEGARIQVGLESGRVVRTEFQRRALLNDLNFLHLNSSEEGTARTVWTIVADAFCVVLVILACSGIFLIRGRKGLLGRGGLWMLLGFLLPVVCILLMR